MLRSASRLSGVPVRAASAKERIRYGAVRERGRVDDFQQAIAHHEMLPVFRLQLGGARGVEQSLAQRQRNRRFLFQVPQQLPVQRPRMPKVQAHPLRRRSCDAVTHAQRALRRGGLQFVGQRVVVAPIAVVQKTADRAQKINRRGGKLFLRGRDFGACRLCSSTICRSQTVA